MLDLSNLAYTPSEGSTAREDGNIKVLQDNAITREALSSFDCTNIKSDLVDDGLDDVAIVELEVTCAIVEMLSKLEEGLAEVDIRMSKESKSPLVIFEGNKIYKS